MAKAKVNIRIDGQTIRAATDFMQFIYHIGSRFAGPHEPDNSDPYKILGISPNASIQEIDRRYRQLSQVWHPDKQGGNLEAMKKLNQAYSLIRQQRLPKS